MILHKFLFFKCSPLKDFWVLVSFMQPGVLSAQHKHKTACLVLVCPRFQEGEIQMAIQQTPSLVHAEHFSGPLTALNGNPFRLISA